MSHLQTDIQCKHAAPQRFKFAVGDTGKVQGFGAVFGNVDAEGERIIKGAFQASLTKHQSEGRMPIMLWQHRREEPIGRWIVARETDIGLLMEGEFNLNTSRGRDAFEHAKAGDVTGLSIGYREVRTRANGDVRELVELDLLETSIVSFPANPHARITGVKAESSADVERILREGGLPRAYATKFAQAGWAALTSETNIPEIDIEKVLARLSAHAADRKSWR